MNRAQSIRATLLSFAELVVITVATLGLPVTSGSFHDRTVRLLRGMNQRAVFESGCADEIAVDRSPEISSSDSVPDERSLSGEASGVPFSSLLGFGSDAQRIVAFPIALEAARAPTGAPLRARAPPLG